MKTAHIFVNGTVVHLEGDHFPIPFDSNSLNLGVWMLCSWPVETAPNSGLREIAKTCYESYVARHRSQNFVIGTNNHGDPVIAIRQPELDQRGKFLAARIQSRPQPKIAPTQS